MRARVDAEIKQNVSAKNGIETDIYRINTPPSFENYSMAKHSIIVRGNPKSSEVIFAAWTLLEIMKKISTSIFLLNLIALI